MVTNTDLRIAGGCLTVFFALAVLSLPIWLASLAWWGWFLAVPAGIVIYGGALGMLFESIQKERYRKALRADAKQAEREARKAYNASRK